MRRYWVLLFFAVFTGLAAACGSDGAVPPTSGAATAEAATATEEPQASPADLGTLEVRVTDQPAADVSAIVLTVQNIEVNTSGGADSGWQIVVEGPHEFDLLQLEGIEDVLGSATLAAGRYEQIRLEVVSAEVTLPNGVRQATVPSDKIRLIGGFEVLAGETTIVTLDFDAGKSVVFIPMRGPQLIPVVKLLVRKKGQTLAEAEVVGNVGEDIAGGGSTSTTGPMPGRAPQTNASGLTPVRVVVPTAGNLQFMSFWIAVGAGYFQDEGLDVQVIIPPDPTGTGNFLLQGRADVAIMQPPVFLPMIAQEDPIVVFGNLIKNDAINLVVKPDVAAQRNLSAASSLEERLRGIRGLKVGIAPGPPTRLRVLFESVGLDADSDIEMVILSGHEQNPAFEDGSVDALYAHTPFLEEALVRQGAVLLVNQSAGEVPELGGNRQGHSLVTTRAFASDERDVLVAIIRAVQSAQDLAHTDLAATVEAVLQSGVPDLDRELVETIVGIYAAALPNTPAVTTEGVARALELFPDHRVPPDLSGIDLNDYVDTDVVKRAES